MTTLLVLCCFSLPLAGVFGADTVSVMEGDSVTLPNHFKMNKGDELEWMFERATIAGTIQSKVTDKFSGRLEFNNQTGSLTIRNIRTNESGLYTLQFRPAQEVKTRTFRVTVIEGVYTVSVVKGNPFSLTTDVHQQHDDVIEWRFNGKILPDLTGHELNITNARTDQSGEYKVKIYGTHRILQKTFRVEINELPWQNSSIFLYVLVGVVIVVVKILICTCHCCECKDKYKCKNCCKRKSLFRHKNHTSITTNASDL